MIDFNMQNVGKRIKQLRIENGLSQKELAERVGVAQNTLAQYEKGTSRTSLDVLVRLAVELETTTDFILGLVD